MRERYRPPLGTSLLSFCGRLPIVGSVARGFVTSQRDRFESFEKQHCATQNSTMNCVQNQALALISSASVRCGHANQLQIPNAQHDLVAQ
jgi:hypothetical protein